MFETGKSWSASKKISSVSQKIQLIYIKSNRMRNIHAHIIQEYGQESVKTFRRWEIMEIKMADFKNHRRFTLRCLSKGIVPVSIKLKSTVKTPKGIYIVRKAERMLMNERIRSINNTITMLNCQIHTCINNHNCMLNKEVIKECHEFINYRRERRHSRTLERQKNKFEQLWQKNTSGHSNTLNGWGGYHSTGTEVNSETTSEATTPEVTSENHNKVKWVHNLSKTPLTDKQEKALAHGPNFAVAAREPPVSVYISQIERVCQQLKQGEAEELKREIKLILENIQAPKPNVAKEEAKAIQELKKELNKIDPLTAVLKCIYDSSSYCPCFYREFLWL